MRTPNVARRQANAHAVYAFDLLRSAILLIGGVKTGDSRWIDKHVTIADRLYDEHLEKLQKEG